jgi:NADH-quinone oxidoreductase subunit B
MAGIIALQDKIKHGGTLNGTEFGKRTQPMGPTPFDLDELIRIREGNEKLISLS